MAAFEVVRTVSTRLYRFPQPHPLVVINSTFQSCDRLHWGTLLPDAELFHVSDRTCGIAQITSALAGRDDILSLHIVSSGYPGGLYLGNTELNLNTFCQHTFSLQLWAATLRESRQDFVTIGASASNRPQLYLHVAQLAEGDAGQEFFTKLQTIVGSEIAISRF